MKKGFLYAKKYGRLAGLLVLLAAAFSFAMFQGGFVSWFLFYTFLPFACYAILVFFYPIKQFEAERGLEKREFRQGDELSVKLSLSRKNRFPLLYLVVEDWLPDSLAGVSSRTRKSIVFPGFRDSFTLDYQLGPLPRGEHAFQAIRIQTGDFLGLFEKEAQFDLAGRIVVYPAYYELSYRQLEGLFQFGQAGSAKKMQREQSVVSGIREYEPGDQFSWINWKATARTNEIMTKEFEDQRSQDLFLLLDESDSASFEEAVMLAASFAHAAIKRGVQLGFAGTHSASILPVQGGSVQRQKIFSELARVKAMPDSEAELKGRIPQSARVILVTGSLDFDKADAFPLLGTNQKPVLLVAKSSSELTEEEKGAREAMQLKGIQVRYLGEGALGKENTGGMMV
ncbi:DUF58 domain-containing protein [Bacillus massiliglaciei]|uniref:DUF58 domain-containing protein n=1 Tax=Bacillus massiliglaciei TaxID=1816693 RepID=UPI000AADFEE5|nr:DUF58 domain-containing protein [Bacillus massiliglaciei]